MLAETYIGMGSKPVNLDLLKPTKGVRNFLCDHLYTKKLLLSYAPAGEFGSSQAYNWLMGGYICDYDDTGNTIAPRQKINFRVIRSLFDSGLIRVKTDIRTPHTRCVIFEWIPGFDQYRREILRTKVFGEGYSMTHQLVNALAALYGLKVKFVGARSVFEIIDMDGKSIPNRIGNKTIQNTYILMNEQMQPVSRLRDMSFIEWEEVLYATGKRTRSLRLVNHEDHINGFFSSFKKN